ncbi:MAG TPA: efflux RND transporter periplasmic adaptor subunit [Kofleriaceae bacterium]|nr:efflux RND transporter periplasmic adaptor subunit [Kofleriaceae bacterium]
MKRIILPMIAGFGIAIAFVFTLGFLYWKSQKKDVVFETEAPFVTDIVKKTVATGAIVPRQEVEIKPRVSGVIEELPIEAGQIVKRGDLIAKIQIIPNVVNLNHAEAAVKAARISFENADRELARSRDLFAKKVISQAEYQQAQVAYDLKKQELSSAKDNVQLIREGASRGSGKISNQVRSTVDGMIIDVPVELGQSVIEANTFNPGTTIAFVANMKDMIFEGKVDESEVGKIKTGMELAIHIGAIEDRTFKGVLEYIAPKGEDVEGTIQFEIRAALTVPQDDVFIRANYSANADIVLDRKKQVLAIHESLLLFDKKKEPFVEIETAPQVFEKRPVKLGLSDGINIEVVSGVDADTKIKKQIGKADQKKGKKG